MRRKHTSSAVKISAGVIPLMLAYGGMSNGDGSLSASKPAGVPPLPGRKVAVTGLPKTITLDLGGGVKMELVLIPAGDFMMGSESERYNNERPQHRVRINKPFYMGKYEVTQSQWQAVLLINPSKFQGGDLPVEQVPWNACQEFCKKVSGKVGMEVRLPSEAEWEYACRAGTTTPFSFGDTISTSQVNYDGNHPYGNGSKGVYREKTVAVGSFAANQFGLHDMHGNVWEWCEDVGHENYTHAPEDGSAWASGGDLSTRVLRGGSWMNYGDYCRSAKRGWRHANMRADIAGLRVAVSSSSMGTQKN